MNLYRPSLNIAIVVFCLIAVSCNQDRKSSDPLNDDKIVSLKYAEGFKITHLKNAKLVEIIYPYQGATEGHQYLLVQKEDPVPSGYENATIIKIPIERIVCTSTTHIPMLDYLNETDKLVGFPTTEYISSPKMRKRVDAGHVQDLGVDKGLNIELLISSKPSVVMGYTINGNYGQFKKIEAMGIPVVINAEYLEKNPLGRAEWIKFVATFFNKEKMADSVFNTIENAYQTTKTLASQVSSRPTVMSGILYGDSWFLPGGQNYASRILDDAGYDYLWKEDSSQGFLQLNFESVYNKAHDADLWIGVGSFETLEELKNAEPRYVSFRPFKEQNIYTYNTRKGEKGGNEFLELGYLRPDIILNDLVKIAHPELLPNYELYFHKRID